MEEFMAFTGRPTVSACHQYSKGWLSCSALVSDMRSFFAGNNSLVVFTADATETLQSGIQPIDPKKCALQNNIVYSPATNQKRKKTINPNEFLAAKAFSFCSSFRNQWKANVGLFSNCKSQHGRRTLRVSTTDSKPEVICPRLGVKVTYTHNSPKSSM